MLKPQPKIQNYLIIAILFCLPFYFIKFKYSWISLNLIEVLIITLFLLWVSNKNAQYRILNTKYNIPIALIIIGLFLSMIANKNYYTGLGVIKGWFVLPIMFAIILYDNLKKNEKLLDWSLWALFCSGVLVSVEGICYWFSGFLTYDGRLRIFYDSPNQLAMFLGPVFLIGLFLFLKEEGKLKKIICGIGSALIGLGLYFTFSYGAWLATAVALVVLLWLIYGKFMRKLPIVFLLFFLVVFLAWATNIKLRNIENEGVRSSLASREMIWKSAGLMLKNNPLFGIGPGNFQEKYLEYQRYFPPYLEWAVPQPHNLFLAFWLEAGLIGLVGFLWLVGIFFVDNKKAIGNNPHTKIYNLDSSLPNEIKKQTPIHRIYSSNFGDGASRNIGILCLAIMLYFLIHGLVDTTYWRNDMAVLFWAIISINKFISVKETARVDKISNS